MQYSRDANKWDNYEAGQKILYTENGTIHAKLTNALEEEGGTASRPIDKIDKEAPNDATVRFSSTTTDIETPITATVTQTDKGNSGEILRNVNGSIQPRVEELEPIHLVIQERLVKMKKR